MVLLYPTSPLLSFMHIFARGDPFGMLWEEFLMLAYSLQKEAAVEDKLWLAFNVCDFSHRQALGVPELTYVLQSIMAQHGAKLRYLGWVFCRVNLAPCGFTPPG